MNPNPKGKIIPCTKCGKSIFVELNHGFWGTAKCPHCGEEITLMTSPNREQSKMMLRMLGKSEEEIKHLEALQEEFNAKRRQKQQPQEPTSSKPGFLKSAEEKLEERVKAQGHKKTHQPARETKFTRESKNYSQQQVINVTGEDIFERLWVAAAFAPLAVFYTTLLLTLNTLVEYLSTFPILKDINDLLLGYGTSTLVILIVETAAKKSHNDFIAGPIEQLNLYTFFFLGLVTGDIQRALIFVGIYFFAEKLGIPLILKENISKNAEIQARLLGFSRRSFILYHYFLEPIVTLISMLAAYLILDYFFPVREWIFNGIIFQIRFMTLHVVLWTAIYKILLVRVEKIRVTGEFSILKLLVLVVPIIFLPEQIWAWVVYIAGIGWAWLNVGLHIWSGFEESKRVRSQHVFFRRK